MYVISIFHQFYGGLTKSHPYLRRKSRTVVRSNTVSTAQKFTTINMALRYICGNLHRFSAYSDIKIQEIDDYEKLTGNFTDIGKRIKHFNSLTGIYKINNIRDLIIKNEHYDYMVRFTGQQSVIQKQIKSELKSLGIKIKDTKIELEYYSVFLFLNEDDFVKFRLGQSIASNLDFISIKQIWENYES